MKQGTNFHLPIHIGMDLDLVSSVQFVFVQVLGSTKRIMKTSTYPYECERRPGTNIIDIPWTARETYNFAPNSPIRMDTRIILKNCEDQPETCIVNFMLNETMFGLGAQGGTVMSDRVNPRDRIIDVKVLGQLIDNACGGGQSKPPQSGQGCCSTPELLFAHEDDIDVILGANKEEEEKPKPPVQDGCDCEHEFVSEEEILNLLLSK